MEKYRRLAVIFSVSYAIMLILLLVEFFVGLFTNGNVNFSVLAPIITGSVTYMVLTVVIKEKEDSKE